MSKVTSVELEEEDVKYIESLINEGRVRSLKELVEKCIKFGIAYTLDQWQPGVFNVGPVRIIILIKKALELIVEHVPEEDREDLGRELGEIVASFAQFHRNIECSTDWDSTLKFLTELGWGQFKISSDNILQIIAPAFPIELMKGCLEEILNVRLEATRLKIDVQQFKIFRKT
jgi:hypothetical protein